MYDGIISTILCGIKYYIFFFALIEPILSCRIIYEFISVIYCLMSCLCISKDVLSSELVEECVHCDVLPYQVMCLCVMCLIWVEQVCLCV